MSLLDANGNPIVSRTDRRAQELREAFPVNVGAFNDPKKRNRILADMRQWSMRKAQRAAELYEGLSRGNSHLTLGNSTDDDEREILIDGQPSGVTLSRGVAVRFGIADWKPSVEEKVL